MTLIFFVCNRWDEIHVFLQTILTILYSQSGILLNQKRKLFSSLDRVSSFHPEDELEVMGLGFFILPNIFLVVGLALSLLCFLCELYVFSKK